MYTTSIAFKLQSIYMYFVHQLLYQGGKERGEGNNKGTYTSYFAVCIITQLPP